MKGKRGATGQRSALFSKAGVASVVALSMLSWSAPSAQAATSTLLPQGDVLIAGGEFPSGEVSAAAELYDSLQPRGNVTFGTLVYLAKKHPRTTPAEETNTTTTVDGFIRIKRELWRRPEVGGLSPIAKLILVELHYCYTGTNNGELCLPYLSLVRRIRCSRASIKRAFGELHQAGLIETTVSGSFDHKGGARKGVGSRYRLTRI